MKNRFLWVSAVALAATVGFPDQTLGLTNGLVIISTRTASDALYRQISSSSLYDVDDYKGPGNASPGDAAMANLLMDYGYSTRLVPEWLLRPDALCPQVNCVSELPIYSPVPYNDWIYAGGGGPTRPGAGDSNILMSAQLVIVSGSGSSFDMPPPNTNGIGIVMGEVSCIRDAVLNGNSSIYMYGGAGGNGDQTFTAAQATNGPLQYMKVVAPNHPIMQGIPLEADGRVKIWRDPYPEESAHVPTGGKPNYLGSWMRINTNLTVAAAGTETIGMMGPVVGQETNVVFSVNPKGGALYAGAPEPFASNHGNLVQFFVNERGSGDARRAFCNLTELGKVIFVRACKWAMGETLTPYQPLGIIQTSLVSPNKIQLQWSGQATSNYKVLGTVNLQGPGDFSNWQTIVQDIHGIDPGVGPTSVKLDIANGPQYAFLRVAPMP